MRSLEDLRGGRFTAVLLGLVVAGLAVAYGNSFGVGFYFDDGYGIRDNPAIRSLANIPSFFTDPFTLTVVRENVDIRPLLVTTFALNHAVSGLEPWSYHAFNLLVHLLTTMMVFVLVRDHLWWPVVQRGPSGPARFPAAAAALLFALAPVNNQALNYMWARSALLCTFFYVAAFLMLVRGRHGRATLLHVLALMVKAIALTLPATWLAWDLLYRDREQHPGLRDWLVDWRRLAKPVLLLAVVNVLYLALRHYQLPPWANDTTHEVWVTPWIWMMSSWSALLHYVRIFFWPVGMTVDTDFPYTTAFTEPRAWGALLVLVAWAGAALAVSRRHPHVAFASAWFFLTLAPESTFSPLAEVVNDHRPYIASTLGLSLLGASILHGMVGLLPRRRREVYAVTVLLVAAAFAQVGRWRTADWQTPGTLWEATIRTSPGNARGWMNAGVTRLRQGDYAAAKERFEKAGQLSPRYAYVPINLSMLARLQGNAEESLAQARRAVELGPNLAPTHHNLAMALDFAGRRAEALDEARIAVRIDPRNPEITSSLAKLEAGDREQQQRSRMARGLALLDQEHDASAAVEVFRSMLAVEPSHYGATFQLARALEAAGRKAEAVPIWETMLGMARQAEDSATEKLVQEHLPH